MRLTVVQLLPALEAGGVERGAVEIARALVERGHRAIVVSRGGRLTEALQSAGAEHVTLDIGRKSPLTLLRVAPLARLLGESRAHILHARSRLPAWIGVLARRRLGADAPHLVTTVHGPYSVNAYSAVMARGERVIAISEFIRDYIRANYPRLDGGRVHVIPRGVSPDEFPHGYQPPASWIDRWRRDFPHLAGTALLTFPARITRWKGQEDFIELLNRLRARGQRFHGLIVGGAEGNRRGFLRELQDQVRRLDLESHVSFLGHRDDVREIMSVSCAVLALTRVPEAFGRTALEALSLGVPVVGYAHGGTAEILRPIYPAGQVMPGDIDAAAESVSMLLRQRPAIPAQHPFPLQRMVNETLDLYQELVSQRR
ncbi:MAG: glycosyltransferase family 4 protein [Gammaproteobacteria bacterium]|nr:glycosyltransferase family 4 protein [Gammaproteobacteria bacterium]